MMLLVDSGNSAIKTRLLTDGQAQDRQFIVREGLERSGFIDYLEALSVGRVYLASVASAAVQDQIRAAIERCLPGANFKQLQTLPRLDGLTNAYAQHQQLGIDRWLTLLAAKRLVPGDAVIVDAGSAITIDLLSRDRGHLGGAILPGLNTDLSRFIDLFPHVDFTAPEVKDNRLPGRSTAACINVETMPVDGAVVDRIIQRWLPLLESPVQTLLCGQDAPRIGEQLALDWQPVPDLVFIGMLKQIECLR